jgi:uncharacterized protein (DUF58 family)
VSVPGPSGEGLRFRPRAVLMFAAAGVLAVVALAVHSSVPLLLAVPLLLGPAAAATSSPRLPPSYRISWSSEGSRGAVEVTGRLDPTEGGSVQGLVPTFYRPEPLVDAEPPEVRLDGESLTFCLHWSAPYPCLVSVSLPRVQWRDPLGLVERPVGVEGQALRLQRFPPELARASRAPLRRTTSLPGEVRARQLGGAGEFFAIRPLAASDTRRQVNWRASARAGRMLANDYRVERTGDLLIVLDLRPTSLGAEIDARLASVAAAGAYGLAQSFLEQKARVGLALYTDFVDSIPLGSGRRQRFRLLRALQAARVGETAGPSERLAVSLRRYFPPGVTTVLLSALADEESTLVLPHLRRRGFPAFVLSPSPVPLLGRLGARPTEDDARALRLLRLVRRRRIAEAWSEAAVVEWDDYWSLASLASFFARPAGRRAAT